MPRIGELIYICDKKIDFDLVDLLIDSCEYSQIDIYEITKNKKNYVYRCLNIHCVNTIDECPIARNKKIILDLNKENRKKISYLIKTNEIVFVNEYIEQKDIKKCLLPVVFVSGFASYKKQLMFCLNLKNKLMGCGEKVLLLSNYTNAEIFDAININKIIFNKSIFKMGDIINNLLKKSETEKYSKIIINVNHNDEIKNKQYNYRLNIFLKLLIIHMTKKFIINLVPYNFIDILNNNITENDSNFLEYGFFSDLHILTEEIFTNGINGGKKFDYVDISKSRHFKGKQNENIIYNDECTINKTIERINKINNNISVKEIL